MGFSGTNSSDSSIARGSDVALNNPAASDVISYDATISKWKNVNLDNRYIVTFNPFQFGAIGDKTTNDSAAIQAMFDAAANTLTDGRKTTRVKIVIPSGYKFGIPDGVTFKAVNCDIEGGGVLANGTLTVGWATGTATQLNSTIHDIRFEYDARATGNIGINIGKSRVVTIQNNVFVNMDKAISVAATQEYAFHDISQIKIFDNQFVAVNYAVKVELYNDYTTNTDRWMTCADWQICRNISNVAVVQHVQIDAIDGAHISDNTFFFSSSPSLRDLKEACITIGTANDGTARSNWLTIHDNHIFEAGWEAILITNGAHYTITGNEIAWCGQREPRASISINGVQNESGLISNNVISNFTGNGVDILSTGSGIITVSNNALDYSEVQTTYFGNVALNSIIHRTVYQPRTNVEVREFNNTINTSTANIVSNIKNHYGSTYSLTSKTSLNGTFISANISAAGASANLLSLESIASSASGTGYAGLVSVIASHQNANATNNLTASYLLNIVSANNVQSISLINAVGNTTGASANEPSVTFSVNSSKVLVATGVGSSSGTIFFNITFIGNITGNRASSP